MTGPFAPPNASLEPEVEARASSWTDARRYGIAAVLVGTVLYADPLLVAYLDWVNLEVAIGLIMVAAIVMILLERRSPGRWALMIVPVLPLFVALLARLNGIRIVHQAIAFADPSEAPTLVAMGLGEAQLILAVAAFGSGLLLSARALSLRSWAVGAVGIVALAVAAVARLDASLLMGVAQADPALKTIPWTVATVGTDVAHLAVGALLFILGAHAVRRRPPLMISVVPVLLTVLYHGWLTYFCRQVMFASYGVG